jgi:hypothetical protein
VLISEGGLGERENTFHIYANDIGVFFVEDLDGVVVAGLLFLTDEVEAAALGVAAEAASLLADKEEGHDLFFPLRGVR